MPEVLGAALQNGNSWIRENAINASRYLPKPRPDLGGRIWRSIAGMPEDDFRREQRRLSYAFQLSSGLSGLRKLIKARANDIRDWRWIGVWIAVAVRFWHLLPVYIYNTLMLREPPADALTTAEGKVLAELEHDKSSGLTGYRRLLASTQLWRDASLVIVLAMALIIYVEVNKIVTDNSFGEQYALPAIVYAMEVWSDYFTPLAFLALSLWIAPFFAGRSYSLVFPGEELPKRTWKDRLSGVHRWGKWSLIAITFVLSLAAMGIGGRLIFGALKRGLDWIAGKSTGDFISWYTDKVFLVVYGGGFALFIGAICLSGIFYLVSQQRLRLSEEKLLTSFTSIDSDNTTRSQIAERFAAFKTIKAREKYIRWLASQRLEPMGEWPDGARPIGAMRQARCLPALSTAGVSSKLREKRHEKATDFSLSCWLFRRRDEIPNDMDLGTWVRA